MSFEQAKEIFNGDVKPAVVLVNREIRDVEGAMKALADKIPEVRMLRKKINQVVQPEAPQAPIMEMLKRKLAERVEPGIADQLFEGFGFYHDLLPGRIYLLNKIEMEMIKAAKEIVVNKKFSILKVSNGGKVGEVILDQDGKVGIRPMSKDEVKEVFSQILKPAVITESKEDIKALAKEMPDVEMLDSRLYEGTFRTVKTPVTPKAEGVGFSLATMIARYLQLGYEDGSEPAGIGYIDRWLSFKASPGLYSLAETVESVRTDGSGIDKDAIGYYIMVEYEGVDYRVRLTKDTLVITLKAVEAYLDCESIPEAVKDTLRELKAKMTQSGKNMPIILEGNIPMLRMMQKALLGYGYVVVRGHGIILLTEEGLRDLASRKGGFIGTKRKPWTLKPELCAIYDNGRFGMLALGVEGKEFMKEYAKDCYLVKEIHRQKEIPFCNGETDFFEPSYYLKPLEVKAIEEYLLRWGAQLERNILGNKYESIYLAKYEGEIPIGGGRTVMYHLNEETNEIPGSFAERLKRQRDIARPSYFPTYKKVNTKIPLFDVPNLVDNDTPVAVTENISVQKLDGREILENKRYDLNPFQEAYKEKIHGFQLPDTDFDKWPNKLITSQTRDKIVYSYYDGANREALGLPRTVADRAVTRIAKDGLYTMIYGDENKILQAVAREGEVF
ncbi:MAG: hypothetical protein KAR31_00300, partial [Candidatus Omnitrophica bacterium]|nr:hypothetical protein [Candidatus Omnitrophota bacterium]